MSVEASSLTVDIILGCVVVSTLDDSVCSTIDFRNVVVFFYFLSFSADVWNRVQCLLLVL